MITCELLLLRITNFSPVCVDAYKYLMFYYDIMFYGVKNRKHGGTRQCIDNSIAYDDAQRIKNIEICIQFGHRLLNTLFTGIANLIKDRQFVDIKPSNLAFAVIFVSMNIYDKKTIERVLFS